jgi:hypothetical protein
VEETVATYCALTTVKTERARSSKTLVTDYQSTRHHISEDIQSSSLQVVTVPTGKEFLKNYMA